MNYKPVGVCSRNISFEVDEKGYVHNVSFLGGCPGNALGISTLVEDMYIDDVIKKFEGIKCRPTTSCPDQLAKALKQYKIEHNL